MYKILSLTIIRNESQVDMLNPLHINSKICINYSNKSRFRRAIIPLIENREHIFPVGVYNIQFEYSPKFHRKLWEFKDIPNRTEIKFHVGTKSEHTKGCLITTSAQLNKLHSILKGQNSLYVHVKTT